MKLTTNDGETYIAKREKFYKYTICFSVFIGVYGAWCLYNIMSNIILIAFNSGGIASVFGGTVHVVCLFMCAMWFDEVLNDV